MPQSSDPGPVAVANRDDGLDACFARPRDYLLAVSVELLAIEMRVGIDETSVVGRWSLVVQEIPLCNSVSSVVEGGCPTSASSRPAHPRESLPALASRPRPMPPQSCHSIPVRAACAGEIGHDHHFAPDQRLRRVGLGDAGHDLPDFVAEIHFQPEQFVRPFDFLGHFHLSHPQFDLGEIIDADLAVGIGAAAAGFAEGRRQPLAAAVPAASGFAAAARSSLLFHLLHPFDCALVCSRKHRIDGPQASFPTGVVPTSGPRAENFLISPRPSCVQIFAVASGITGCASAVTIRNASALVYSTVANRARLSSSCFSPSAQGSFSTMYLSTAATRPSNFERARELILLKQPHCTRQSSCVPSPQSHHRPRWPRRCRRIRHLAAENTA